MPRPTPAPPAPTPRPRSPSPPRQKNGSPITGYTVTASPGGQTATGTASPILITGLTNGVAYTFTVTATNGVGTSLPSAASNSVTPAPTAPDAPTNAKAAGGDSQARVSFDAPAENGSPITGYTVTSNPGGVTATGAGSPITITGLSNGSRYTFTVTATNAIGTSLPSAPSNSIIAMVLPLAYFIDTDHLDTPRMITDVSGNVVWDWPNSDPYANNPPNENPSGQGTFVSNLGLPGQYRDKETNTFYNGFRDCYDPATGRYCQSDPFGLAAGINTYVYALSNPLSYTDPDGRNPILLAGLGVAAAFYFGIDQLSSLLQAKWKFEELQQLNNLKNAQIGCANSGGQSCGDPQKTEAAINQCSRESIPAASDAGYSQLPSPAEKGVDLLKKAIK